MGFSCLSEGAVSRAGVLYDGFVGWGVEYLSATRYSLSRSSSVRSAAGRPAMPCGVMEDAVYCIGKVLSGRNCASR